MLRLLAVGTSLACCPHRSGEPEVRPPARQPLVCAPIPLGALGGGEGSRRVDHPPTLSAATTGSASAHQAREMPLSVLGVATRALPPLRSLPALAGLAASSGLRISRDFLSHAPCVARRLEAESACEVGVRGDEGLRRRAGWAPLCPSASDPPPRVQMDVEKAMAARKATGAAPPRSVATEAKVPQLRPRRAPGGGARAERWRGACYAARPPWGRAVHGVASQGGGARGGRHREA